MRPRQLSDNAMHMYIYTCIQLRMYYVMRVSAPSLHRESTDSLIYIYIFTAGDRSGSSITNMSVGITLLLWYCWFF